MVLPIKDWSEASLTSVSTMLDMTFGDEDSNLVDFRVMHALLLLLARAMSVLERQVIIKFNEFKSTLMSPMSVSEVKIRGKGKKKKKAKKEEKKGKKGKKAKGKKGYDSDESSNSSDEEGDDGTRGEKEHYHGKKSRGEDDEEDRRGKHDKRRRDSDEEYSDDEKGAGGRRHGQGHRGKREDYPDLDDGRQGGKRDKGDKEMLTEKLLIVELTPSGEGFISPTSGQRRPKSIATKEDYQRLLAQVMQLRARFGPIDIPGFEIFETMYQQTVLSDPVSILQLSARLEYMERAINEIYSLLLGLAGMLPQKLPQGITVLPGGAFELGGIHDEAYGPGGGQGGTYGPEGEYEGAYGPTAVQSGVLGLQGAQSRTQTPRSVKSGPIGPPSVKSGPIGPRSVKSGALGPQGVPGVADGTQGVEGSTYGPESGDVNTLLQSGQDGATSEVLAVLDTEDDEWMASETIEEEASTSDPNSLVEPQHFKLRLEKAKRDLPKMCIPPTKRTQLSANQTKMKADGLLEKVLKTSKICNKVDTAEESIKKYGFQISSMDSTYASEVTRYQEELTEMQKSLEDAVDYMSECLATRVPDTEAIDELNRKFNVLEIDLESTYDVQIELDSLLDEMDNNLLSVRDKVRELQDTKYSRHEVEEALESKASVSQLNGKMSRVHFGAVYGELEKSISFAFDKFNNQEIYWQKCIDDLDRESRQKAHKNQVESFRVDIKDKMSTLQDRIDAMIKITHLYRPLDTEPESRQLMRTVECVSCGTGIFRPAEKPMKKVPRIEEPSESTVTVRKQAVASSVESDGGGDREPGVCYPTDKIKHPVAPRTKGMRKCIRICGERFRSPDFPFDIKTLKKDTLSQPETVQKPCIPCNPPPPARRPPRRLRRLAAAQSMILGKIESEVMEEGLGEEEQEPDTGSIGSLERYLKYSMYFGPGNFMDAEENKEVKRELNEGEEHKHHGEEDGKGLEAKTSIRERKKSVA